MECRGNRPIGFDHTLERGGSVLRKIGGAAHEQGPSRWRTEKVRDSPRDNAAAEVGNWRLRAAGRLDRAVERPVAAVPGDRDPPTAEHLPTGLVRDQQREAAVGEPPGGR